MKRLSLVVFVFFIAFVLYFFQSYLHKKKVTSQFAADIHKVKIYSDWGFETYVFEKLYKELLTETDSTHLLAFPFKVKALTGKHDRILLLTQSGYATEVTRQKTLIQNRLTYLRDRVKNNAVISQNKKQFYFDTFEVIAGNVFEKNSDLGDLKTALASLQTQDVAITKEIESIRKESLLNELRSYRSTCDELVLFFLEKNSQTNLEQSQNCVTSANKLLQPEYTINGADFIESLSRERVFEAMQKVTKAKQQLIQDEQYALAAKKKEEERLTVVPPAPRQEGKIVVVNLSLQRLYAYENGSTLFPNAVPITTGKQGFETVTGEFAIYLKAQQHKMVSPFPGIYYDDVVNYWMPFYLGYGLHDAPWRSVYGTQDYSVVGSHGCINIPFKETSILYNWAELGTRVIVL